MNQVPIRLTSPRLLGAGLPAFDTDQPPSSELIDDCVHCGFCLSTCPTYSLWGEEMDSPRGRIQLMKQGLEGDELTDTMVGHFDACLGCMACVTACPSGVQYDRLIAQTRAQVERRHKRGVKERLLRGTIFTLFPYPKRLRMLRGPLRAYQRSGIQGLVKRSGFLERVVPSLAAMESLAPPLRKAEALPDRLQATGPRRAVVGMLTGCVQRVFFSDVNAATARVLAAEGCDVIMPRHQQCCGALSAHTGRSEEARQFARALIDCFSQADVEYVVVNAAGCGSSMKEYAELLAEDSEYAVRAKEFSHRVRDLSELLIELGTVAIRHPLPITAAYHDACHLAHAQSVRTQPRALLQAIPELVLREIADSEICCGSAGVYNILHPDAARELGDRKAANVLATQADFLVTANPGCLMQVATSIERAGGHVELAHTAQVLDASIRGVSLHDVLTQ
jgi:glycolate oxidase iron-sulfur subunit